MIYSQEIQFNSNTGKDDHTEAIDAAAKYLKEKFGAKILDLKWTSRTNGYRFDIIACADNDGVAPYDRTCFVFADVFVRHDGNFSEIKNKEKKRSTVEPAADEWLGNSITSVGTPNYFRRFDAIDISVTSEHQAILRHQLGYL